jgi:Arc/MetJ family transcription regulator
MSAPPGRFEAANRYYSLTRRWPISAWKTNIEISEELLSAVQEVLCTETLKETIEEAFREVLRAEARRKEVQALSTMRGMDLTDQSVMSRVWRS